MNIKGKEINNKMIITIVVAIIVIIGGIVGISVNSNKSNAENNASETSTQKDNNVASNKDDETKETENLLEEEVPTVNITKDNKNFTTKFLNPDKIIINKDGTQINLTEEENNEEFNGVMNIINKMFNDNMSLKETTVTLDDMSNILTEQSAIQLMYADDQKGNFKINGGEEGAEKTYNEVVIPLSGDSTNLVFLYGSEQPTYSEALSEFKHGEELIKSME